MERPWKLEIIPGLFRSQVHVVVSKAINHNADLLEDALNRIEQLEKAMAVKEEKDEDKRSIEEAK